MPLRRLELLRQPVPARLLHRHLPAVLRRGAFRGKGALHRPPGRVPGADRRGHAGRRLAGAGTSARRSGAASSSTSPWLLLAVCAVAGVLATRARPGRAGPAGAGADGGAFPGADPVRVHQLGPDRARADRAGHRRVGGSPRGVGRRPARPRGRGQVLPAGGLRAAAAALPAGGQAARVREDPGRRGDRLAGREPAGDDRRAVRLGALLRVQQGPGRRLGLDLVHVRALQRAGAR